LVSENSLFHLISAPASQEYFHANPAQVVQPSFLLSPLHCIPGNFYERTLEPEDGPPSLFQDLCGSPPCASFAARWTFDMPCINTNSKRIVEEIVFMVFF